MTDEIKILLALDQIDNLTSLIENNESQDFLYFNLIQIQVELKRQLTNLRHSTK